MTLSDKTPRTGEAGPGVRCDACGKLVPKITIRPLDGKGRCVSCIERGVPLGAYQRSEMPRVGRPDRPSTADGHHIRVGDLLVTDEGAYKGRVMRVVEVDDHCARSSDIVVTPAYDPRTNEERIAVHGNFFRFASDGRKVEKTMTARALYDSQVNPGPPRCVCKHLYAEHGPVGCYECSCGLGLGLGARCDVAPDGSIVPIPDERNGRTSPESPNEDIAQRVFKALGFEPYGGTDDKGVWSDSWREKGVIRRALLEAFERGRLES